MQFTGQIVSVGNVLQFVDSPPNSNRKHLSLTLSGGASATNYSYGVTTAHGWRVRAVDATTLMVEFSGDGTSWGDWPRPVGVSNTFAWDGSVANVTMDIN